jgi:hypothetical protein
MMRQEEKPAVPPAAWIAGAAVIIAVAIGLVVKAASDPGETIAPPDPPAAQISVPSQESAPATTVNGKPIPKRSGGGEDGG